MSTAVLLTVKTWEEYLGENTDTSESMALGYLDAVDHYNQALETMLNNAEDCSLKEQLKAFYDQQKAFENHILSNWKPKTL